MKSVIGITLAAAMAVTPLAVKANELCDNVSELAGHVMEAHQNAVPMMKVMRAISGVDATPEATEFTRQMVMSAYGQTRWHTEHSKMRAISDFRDEWYLACLKSGA